MKTKTLFWIAIVFSLAIYSQTTVEGRLLEKGNYPIAGATIQLLKETTEEHAVTDDSGKFLIEVNEKGTYTVEIRFVGFKTYRSKIEVNDKSINLKDIYLEEANTQLQAVEIVGRTKKEYNSKYSFSAMKIATKNEDLSQAISTVTKELIADRQAFRVGDVLKNVSGVNQVSFHNHFSIRGVTGSGGDGSGYRLVNGMKLYLYYFNQPLTSNIERVEVIKGPASMTFSNTDAGGTINLITKKPLAEKRNQIGISFGSFQTFRSELDFTGPLNEDKSLLYRLNIGYENSEHFRDLQFKKAYLISPSFSYIPNEKTRINLELTISDDQSRLDRGQHIFGDFNLRKTPIESSIGALNDYNRHRDVTIMGSLNHKFSDKIGLNINYSKFGWQEDLLEHRSANAFGVNIDGKPIENLVSMRVVDRTQKWFTDNLNMYLNTDFNLGKIKNKMVFGYDFLFQEVRNGGDSQARGYVNAAGTGVIRRFDKNNPQKYTIIEVNGVKMPKPNVPHHDLLNPKHLIGNLHDYIWKKREFPRSAHTVHGIYLMNEMTWNKFILNFGLRQEWYKDYSNYKNPKEKETTQKKFLTRLGLMYKLNENINLYSTYVEGFRPQTMSNLDPEKGGPFDPMSNSMIEFGAKTNWLNKKLRANFAYFNITEKNILVNAGDPLNDKKLAQRGEQKSKGFEIDITGNLLPNLQTNIAYSYIDGKITNDPKYQGLKKENTPENTFNFWSRYDFRHGVLKNFGIGAGINFVDKRIPWLVRKYGVEEYILPSYTLADMAIYYKIKKMQVAVNVNNLFNQEYWVGGVLTRLYPGTPRNFMINVKYNF